MTKNNSSIEICEPIAQEVGDPVDLSLFQDFPDVFNNVADQEAATRSHPGDTLAQAANRTRIALGCAECALNVVCTTNAVLGERIQFGQKNDLLDQQIKQLQQAPPWLSAARLYRANLLGASDKELQDTVTNQGIENLASLLGDISNSPLGVVAKTNLPELTPIAAIPAEAGFVAHKITTKSDFTYTVVDASEAVGFKGQPLSKKEHAILIDKLLYRMTEPGVDGQPQILHPDNTMQKSLRRLGNADLEEIRMSGKNRLYITVHTPRDGQDARIVILGSHGGDAHTQQRFIDGLFA